MDTKTFGFYPKRPFFHINLICELADLLALRTLAVNCWRKLLGQILDKGTAIASLPSRIIKKSFRTRTVYFFVFEGPIEPSVDCIHLSAEMTVALRKWCDFPWRNDETFERRFAEGSHLYGLRKENEWVSFGWVNESPHCLIGELGGWVDLKDPVLWIWDCVTIARHRGNGYFPELLRGIVARKGKLLPIVWCSTDNVSSHRGITKAGFQCVFRIRRYVIGALIRKLLSNSLSVTFSPRHAD